MNNNVNLNSVFQVTIEAFCNINHAHNIKYLLECKQKLNINDNKIKNNQFYVYRHIINREKMQQGVDKLFALNH